MEDSASARRIYTGDNLPILRSMNSESVDLIYLDPPFNSGKHWANPIRAQGKKAFASFKDTWDLSDIHADHEYAMRRDCPQAADLIDALTAVNGDSWKAYLIYMGARLLEIHRILKPHGSVYYHCDPVMSHGVKLLMDAIFGGGNFRNEIVWCYRGAGYPKRDFGRRHDILLRYSKTGGYVFNLDAVRGEYAEATKKRFAHHIGNIRGGRDFGAQKLHEKGRHPDDWWAIQPIAPSAKERTGYPTQKPLALLKRIIAASSNEGDLVLDPFCGCATTCLAAEHLGRAWIGIDLSQEAKKIVLARLKEDVVAPLADPDAEVRHIEIQGRRGLPRRTDIHRTPDRILRPQKYERQNGQCAGCGRRVDLADLATDHIIDRASGGQDEDQNIQLLCTPCNSQKGDRGMEYLLTKIAARMAREQLDELRRRRLEEIQRRGEADDGEAGGGGEGNA